MEVVKKAKKHVEHAFLQFRLTQNLLYNLSQIDVSPTAKLVLLEISACYNPETNVMFPKQATIAARIGCSERSIIRAIQELVKASLITVEGKYTYQYKFTQYLLNLCGMVKILQMDENDKKEPDNLSPTTCQNVTQEDDKMSPLMIEPINEPIKEPTKVVDYKILKEYAEQHGAKNVNSYIKVLRKNGVDKKIIADFKAAKAAENFAKNQILETKRLVNTYNDMISEPPPEKWLELKEKLRSV